MAEDIEDWDDAYANGAYIPGAAEYPPRWEMAAKAYRGPVSADLDIAYGDHPRQRFDLFWPNGTPKGLAVFVHGGYWHRLDNSYWSHLAQGMLAQGWAVAIPSYTLAPVAHISEITREIAAAIQFAAERISGPIRLAGHSAGGHLVSRMVCQDSPLPNTIQQRIAKVLSISGIHDLRPLLLADMNQTLRLTAAEAEQESPVLQLPVAGIPVAFWVGAAERPELLRQTRLTGMRRDSGLGQQKPTIYPTPLPAKFHLQPCGLPDLRCGADGSNALGIMGNCTDNRRLSAG